MALLASVLMLAGGPAGARTERVVVHSPALEGNLQGNSPDRTVYVFLPLSYDSDKARRYPVLYFLHGFNSTAEEYVGLIPFDADLQAAGKGAQEMLIVVPDTDTKFRGSMYANSPTTGNFESFIVDDLLSYVDSHYRTIPTRSSRGLAGHSMGGYGALRIGMKHPEKFIALYAMNPCCALPFGASDPKYEQFTVQQATTGDIQTTLNFMLSTALSANPQKPPFYADLSTENGKPVDAVIAQRAANALVPMTAQYVADLKSMKAIGLDTADKDFVRADATAMHEELAKFGIAHRWEEFQGDHMSGVAERFGTVILPYFARAFSDDGECQRTVDNGKHQCVVTTKP